jgi:Holliday junction resolvase-like predicted endonuclease
VKKKLSSTLCGVAGEYFVAAELSRRGYIASITLRNTRGIDILMSNADATETVGVQVKTNQRGVAEWILSEKIEESTTDSP